MPITFLAGGPAAHRCVCCVRCQSFGMLLLYPTAAAAAQRGGGGTAILSSSLNTNPWIFILPSASIQHTACCTTCVYNQLVILQLLFLIFFDFFVIKFLFEIYQNGVCAHLIEWRLIEKYRTSTKEKRLDKGLRLRLIRPMRCDTFFCVDVYKEWSNTHRRRRRRRSRENRFFFSIFLNPWSEIDWGSFFPSC